jgi:hypothetical protein
LWQEVMEGEMKRGMKSQGMGIKGIKKGKRKTRK